MPKPAKANCACVALTVLLVSRDKGGFVMFYVAAHQDWAGSRADTGRAADRFSARGMDCRALKQADLLGNRSYTARSSMSCAPKQKKRASSNLARAAQASLVSNAPFVRMPEKKSVSERQYSCSYGFLY
jgi:hypothetical protein